MVPVRVRTYRDDDLEAITGLRKAAAAIDRTADGLAIVEPPADPACTAAELHRDTYVVVDDAGHIFGLAQLQVMTGPQKGFIWAFPVVHPQQRGSIAERLLLEFLWDRARQLGHQARSKQVYFYVHCAPHQTERIALCQSLGLRALRDRPHMIYEPLTSVPTPAIPPGIELRPYAKGHDARSAVRTLNEAFADDWEYTPVALHHWSAWMESPRWSVGLNLVAADGEEVVGLCLCLVDEDRIHWLGRKDGYVDTLCVRPSFQRRGVGRALLLSALESLRAAGMVSATLDTDEDNPTQAPRFYRQLGFREAWRWFAYGTELK
jgi:mycothiol synthase